MLTKSASLAGPICCYYMLWRKDGIALSQDMVLTEDIANELICFAERRCT